VLAKADSRANSVCVGVVSSVPDANTFEITKSGVVTVLSPMYVKGATYYLSDTVAGQITVQTPSNPETVVVVLGIGLSTTSVEILLQGSTYVDPSSFAHTGIVITSPGLVPVDGTLYCISLPTGSSMVLSSSATANSNFLGIAIALDASRFLLLTTGITPLASTLMATGVTFTYHTQYYLSSVPGKVTNVAPTAAGTKAVVAATALDAAQLPDRVMIGMQSWQGGAGSVGPAGPQGIQGPTGPAGGAKTLVGTYNVQVGVPMPIAGALVAGKAPVYEIISMTIQTQVSVSIGSDGISYLIFLNDTMNVAGGNLNIVTIKIYLI
jgi:hypothetical protein